MAKRTHVIGNMIRAVSKLANKAIKLGTKKRGISIGKTVKTNRPEEYL